MPKDVNASVMLKYTMQAKSKSSIHFFSSGFIGRLVIGDMPRTMNARVFKATRKIIKMVLNFCCVVNYLPSLANFAFLIMKKNLKIFRKRIAMPTNKQFLYTYMIQMYKLLVSEITRMPFSLSYFANINPKLPTMQTKDVMRTKYIMILLIFYFRSFSYLSRAESIIFKLCISNTITTRLSVASSTVSKSTNSTTLSI